METILPPGLLNFMLTGYSEPSAMENWILSGESTGSGATRSMPIICSFVELVVLRRLGVGKAGAGVVEYIVWI